MNYYEEVEVYDTKETYQTWVDETKFAPDKSRGWWWLQRICFWILNKLKCHISTVSPVYETKKIVFTDDILGEIRRQIYRIKQSGNEPELIIMGGTEEYKLRSDVNTNHLMFTLNVDYRNPLYQQLYGCGVRIIPWMKGIIVIPKSR